MSLDSLREMSDSNAIWLKFAPPVVVGLVNWNEVGCSSLSAVTLVIEPGQTLVYGTPSKSPSISRHPLIFTSSDWDAGRQASSSPSGSWPKSPLLVSGPSGWAHALIGLLVSTLPHSSKCPISSENAML